MELLKSLNPFLCLPLMFRKSPAGFRLGPNAIILFIYFISVFVTGCEKVYTDTPDNKPPYEALEKRIRGKYDSYAVFDWSQYTRLLDILSQDKFVVMPLNEMRKTKDETRVVVGLRHDVDFNVFKALEMSEIEYGYGIRSTYFFLPTAEYYGQFVNRQMIRSAGIGNLYKKIHESGSEIGIHNDLITIVIEQGIDPLQFNSEEIDFFNGLRIKIHGTAAHGSYIAKTTVPNFQIFSDFARTDSIVYEGVKYPIGKHSLADFRFSYEAYFIDFGKYYSDSGGRWNDPWGFEGVLKKLQDSRPGERIQILVHPDWWGKLRY